MATQKLLELRFEVEWRLGILLGVALATRFQETPGYVKCRGGWLLSPLQAQYKIGRNSDGTAKMTANWKRAAVLVAAVAMASCSGTAYEASGEQYGYESGGFDTNWVWAGLSLALLVAVSRN